MQRKAIYFILVCFAFIMTSCNKDKDTSGDCGLFSTVELGEKLMEVSSASEALLESHTNQNCKRYKAAWSGYIDAAEKVLNCSFVDRSELDENIAEARLALAQEDCGL